MWWQNGALDRRCLAYPAVLAQGCDGIEQVAAAPVLGLPGVTKTLNKAQIPLDLSCRTTCRRPGRRQVGD